MDNNIRETNNEIKLLGKVATECTYSHGIYGENFYAFKMEVQRLSDQVDILPVIVSERLIDIGEIKIGSRIKVEGQLRSFNKRDEVEKKNKLLLSIFVFKIELSTSTSKDYQQIKLNGFICKKPIYRTTPFGREICDLLIAVNRSYNKSDYIPCISWGRYAKYTSMLELGSGLKVVGRLQSRTYQKKKGDDEVIERIALEVSLSRVEKVKEIDEKKEIQIRDNDKY